jgi:NAD(P)-dependent dehydrogenase (short-subunit alcohol dehydrogenase family)
MPAKRTNILVTGASSGIGRATAIELASRGHRVIAAARRLGALEELQRLGTGIEPLVLDVTDASSIREAATRVEGLLNGSHVDVLINCAGYALAGPLEALSADAVRHQFETNVFGLLDVTRALLPRMRAGGGGRIINVSSVVGRVAFPGIGAYSATKFAVEALSDALRLEVAPFGIAVVLIEPGFVKTDIGTASRTQAEAFPIAADGYEQLIAKTGEFLATQIADNSLPADTVARKIADVALARRPAARYVLGARNRALVAFMQLLPDRLTDGAKRRALKL